MAYQWFKSRFRLLILALFLVNGLVVLYSSSSVNNELWRVVNLASSGGGKDLSQDEEDQGGRRGVASGNCSGDPDTEENSFGLNQGLCLKVDRQRDARPEELKTILMWNEAYGAKDFGLGGFGREPFYRLRCPETRCYATDDRSNLSSVADFDAIMFHQRSFSRGDLPAVRNPRQRYVHWLMESAQYIYMNIHDLDKVFNWTYTYRQDSDFPNPYGRFHQVRPHPQAGSPEFNRLVAEFGKANAWLAGTFRNGTARTRSRARAKPQEKLRVAWFVSHCATQSRREKYAEELSKYLEVDVYGECAGHWHWAARKLSCGRDREEECYRMLEGNYKFYLSFENSICAGYVTEKVFNVAMLDIVAVSLGGSAGLGTILPPGSSVIDALTDFPSPQDLAQHLKALDADDTRYAELFWWKDFYEVRNRQEDRGQNFCDLCRRLHDPHEPSKVYEDMYDWWVTQSRCQTYRPPLR